MAMPVRVAAAKQNNNKLWIVGAAALVAGAVLGSIAANGNSSSSTTKTVTATEYADAPVSTPTTQPPLTGPMTTIESDGTFLVGKEIVPGTYRTSGGSGGRSDCYWERLSGLGGSNADIIANDGAEGQQLVEILPTDLAFTSAHCQPWEKVG